MSNKIEELKEKYESGNYVCVYLDSEKKIIHNPAFVGLCEYYKLIHKKHEDVLKAYLDGKEIEFHSKEDLLFTATFIDLYDEYLDYRIKETKSYCEDTTINNGIKEFEYIVSEDSRSQKITPNPNTSNALFVNSVSSCLDCIKNMLIDKNLKYGNSALEPIRIFSKSDNIEQIKVRIDDKLSRLKNQIDNEDEDVLDDLIGYLLLLKIALKDKE